MWQALLAAAVAGSTGLVAKHLFKPGSADPSTTSLPEQPQKLHEDFEPLQNGVSNGGFQIPSASTYDSQLLLEDEGVCEKQEGIFRFSCSGSRGGTGVRICSRNLSKRPGVRGRGLKRGVGSEGSNGGVNPRKSGKRVGVCLKKRRTIKNAVGNRGSRSSDDASLFNWGLGVGIVYTMSAGKAEISKLNIAMCETAKVVQELKAELHNRKSSCSLHVSSSSGDVISNSQPTSCKHIQTPLNKSSADNEGPNDLNIFNFPTVDDGEYASSVLTEEPEPEVQEMDQLEAELESELQKLPWCTIEAPYQEELKDLIEAGVSAKGFSELEGQGSDTHRSHEILPAELDQKLCHLLIEQQENQIMELESDLHSVQSKLNEKEAELQALKDCVKRLTEFSLSTVSDDETETHIEQEQANGWNHDRVGSESKKSMVGMKRPIESEPCTYHLR